MSHNSPRFERWGWGLRRAEAPSPLDNERTRLAGLVTAEAARRIGAGVALYETLARLAAKPEPERTLDEALQLEQHKQWSASGQAVEAARQAKLAEVAALTDLEAAAAYDPKVGWP